MGKCVVLGKGDAQAVKNGNPVRRMNLLESWRVYRRARRTIRCHDCESISKAPRAGMVVTDGIPYQVMHDGMKIRFGGYHGAWMAEIIRALKGHHEPQEERIFHEVLKVMPHDAVMIEVGSFWAYYSLWFKRCVPNGRTYMLEPVQGKLQLGIDNFRLNDVEGVFINAFIGASSSEESEFADWDGSILRLPCIAIDDFLDKNKIEFLDILHADIQGAELDMLEGARHSLAGKRIGYLFISTHGDKHERCLAAVRRAGYKMVVQHSIKESCSGDGLIVACSEHAPQISSLEISKAEEYGKVRENMSALVDLMRNKDHRRLWNAIRASS